MGDLTTTNRLLGVMAAVSVVEGLFIIAALGAIAILCRSVLLTVRRLEDQQVSPALSRVNAILDDVKEVTATVRVQTAHAGRLSEWIAELLKRRRQKPADSSGKKVM